MGYKKILIYNQNNIIKKNKTIKKIKLFSIIKYLQQKKNNKKHQTKING